MFKPDPVEQELRDAILACRPGASISVVGGKHNLVLTVVVQRPSPHLEEDDFVRDVVAEDCGPISPLPPAKTVEEPAPDEHDLGIGEHDLLQYVSGGEAHERLIALNREADLRDQLGESRQATEEWRQSYLQMLADRDRQARERVAMEHQLEHAQFRAKRAEAQLASGPVLPRNVRLTPPDDIDGPKPEPEATTVFFDVWYALTQIYEEASSWMRERGVTDDTTLGFIFDRAKMARELVDRPDVRSLLDQIPSVPTPRAVNILGGISYAERRAMEDSPPGEDD